VRRDFVANVSHELRTPLTVIGGFAETLLEDDVPAPRRREFAELIRANASRLQRLVDDLLDLSRIESGGWTPAPVALNTESAIRECVAQVRATADRKGLAIEMEVADDATQVYADPTALRQIIINLLENSLRYTTIGGITVAAKRERGGLRLSVTDTGIGIPAEHLPRIFERFYRVDPHRSREGGGTGLGLAIVRHLAEGHGGSVHATSIRGSGTTVSVFLPDAEVSAAVS
jgi:signal transduction histidine kinase